MAKKLIVIMGLVVALAAGCNSAVLGNITVVMISIGIFIGTLSLSGHVVKRPSSIGTYTEKLSKQFGHKSSADVTRNDNG
jgi:hypothetical protein